MNDQRQLDAWQAYFALMTMNGGARVFRAAQTSGIFPALAAGPRDAAAVAAACGLQAQPTTLLLNALCGLRVVDLREGQYTLAPVMAFLANQYQDLSDGYWDYLPEYLKTGKPLARMDAPEESAQHYQRQAVALGWMMRTSAEVAADLLAAQAGGVGPRILDVGAGAAVWSLALAARNPAAHVTAVDWPAVLGVAVAAAAQAGLAHRFTARPGNYHEVALPDSGFEVCIAANVAHLETVDGIRRLFRKLHAALAPGGVMAVVDVIGGQPAGELAQALYAMGLALRTEFAQVHAAGVLAELLVEAGFTAPQLHALQAPPHTMGMLVARK